MNRSRSFAAFATLALALACAADAQAKDAAERRSLTVVGHGEVRAKPDRAVLTLGVTTRADTAERAASTNARRTREVLEAVRKQLGREDQAESLAYRVQPVYEYPRGGPRELVGFEVVNQIRVRTHAVDRVGSIFDAATGSADVNIDSLDFELRDRGAAEAEALRLAAQDARTRAIKMAEGIGVTLRRVRSVHERGTGGPPPPQPMIAMREAAVADATPVLPRDLEISADVQVTYDIE